MTAERGDRLVVAVPVLARERVTAALRASRSTAGVDAAVRDRLLVVLAIGLGVSSWPAWPRLPSRAA